MAFHPTLGFDRDLRDEPRLCSACSTPIAEDAVRLMLWNESGELAWVYCDPCAMPILALATPAKAPVQ